jgi:hypothetical protein
MKLSNRFWRPLSIPVLVVFLASTLYWPAAQASLIATESVLASPSAAASSARERLGAMLARQELRSLLLARGVSPDEVQARLDSLTDEEIAHLAARLDALPAGGDALGLLVFVFIVLLITDILGFTDIFPFVKKPHERR